MHPLTDGPLLFHDLFNGLKCDDTAGDLPFYLHRGAVHEKLSVPTAVEFGQNLFFPADQSLVGQFGKKLPDVPPLHGALLVVEMLQTIVVCHLDASCTVHQKDALEGVVDDIVCGFTLLLLIAGDVNDVDGVADGRIDTLAARLDQDGWNAVQPGNVTGGGAAHHGLRTFQDGGEDGVLQVGLVLNGIGADIPVLIEAGEHFRAVDQVEGADHGDSGSGIAFDTVVHRTDHIIPAGGKLGAGDVEPLHGMGRKTAGNDGLSGHVLQLVVIVVGKDLVLNLIPVRALLKDLFNKGNTARIGS